MSRSVSQLWSALANEDPDEYGYVRVRVSSECPHALYAALHGPTGMPAIMLELGTDSLPAGLRFPAAVGLRVHAQPIVPGPHGRTRITVELTRGVYRDVFEVLGDDICHQVLAAPTDTDAAAQMVARLSRWQTFLRHYVPDGLSPEQQAGLFGELFFLRSWLLETVGPSAAVASWTGPDAAEQDYQLPSLAVEVKVTRSSSHERLSVSNIRQLDASGVDHLLLLHLSFDVRAGREQTLPSLVDHIEGLLAQRDCSASEAFHTKLAQVGYLDSQAGLYAESSYNLRHHCFYRVERGFPRLCETDLPNGVGDVRYSIAVAAIREFALDDARAEDLLRGAING